MASVRVAGWKSSAGRQAYLSAYDSAMQLWPVPFDSQPVATRFGDTHVVASGSPQAPPVVTFHAATGFGATQWYPNVARISEDYRMHAVEFVGAAGKGRQTAPILNRTDCGDWLADVLDGLGLDRPHIIGSSQGGWLALNFASGHQERVRSLALLAPAASIVPIRPLLRLSIRMGPLMPAWTGPPSIKSMVGGRVDVDERIVNLLTLHLKHFRYQQKAVHPTAFPEDELRGFRVPLLLLIGEHEIIYDSRAALAKAARLFPDIEAELVPGVGHLINMERPEFTDERLLRFFSEHEGN